MVETSHVSGKSEHRPATVNDEDMELSTAATACPKHPNPHWATLGLGLENVHESDDTANEKTNQSSLIGPVHQGLQLNHIPAHKRRMEGQTVTNR